MSVHIRQIDVDGLRIGMYVSQLDRPWIETPFLFQGFCIRSRSEIDELRKYCDFVEIDFEQSEISTSKTQIIKLHGKSKSKLSRPGSQRKRSWWRRFLQLLFGRQQRGHAHSPDAGNYYQDSVSIADELVVAKTLHNGALETLISVLDDVRSGAILRVPDIETVVDGMVDSVLRNSTAMALLVRMQKTDEYTHAHSLATAMWALVFGRHLGLDKDSLRVLGVGGLLLDVGKTRLPTKLLQKRGPLTDVERMHVRNHVGLGLEIIREAESVDRRVIEMVSTHHERFDGSGYPRGLAGSQIPVFGRIGGIVDSYAAMSSDRSYAKAMSSYDAMREFKALSDKSFQAELIEQFIQAIGIFPAGTLVELNTGEIAVVLKEHRASRLRPEVAIILDANKQPLDDFRVVDLDDESADTSEAPDLWILRGVKPGEYDIQPDKYFL
ncbi:MAG: HD-GYP domain-containing protein [Gammaproteobacteria bacterium]|nr:HD-GYP domain-containing protein [Gammaproteobacteria bacterium]NNL45034.1 HD-GYP domain-containing protein [Woeseiaceae bacterium]